ncbi:MAG: M14 family zinc carboxypeptidase [Candidatus Eisenbacteria bacterium]
MMGRRRFGNTAGRALLGAAVLLFLASAAHGEARKVYQEIEIPWPTEEETRILGSFPDLEVMRIERGSTLRLLSTPAITEGLIDAGLRPTVAIEDAAAYHMAGRPRAPGLGAFYSYSETVAFLDSLHGAYPEITTAKDSIGTTWEGRIIWVLKISDNPDLDEEEPEVLFDALHHAREPIGVSVLIDYMRHLCENHGTDPEAAFLVNEREIWFVPVVNPDGYVWNEWEGGSDMMWRKNRRDNAGACEGVDLNRNYGYEWGGGGSSSDPCEDTYRGPNAFSEPETRALRDFILAHDFVAHDSYHSVIGIILYPWGYTATPSSDNATFAAIAAERVRESLYDYGAVGVDYGITSGITIDWAYGADGVLSFTTEVGGSWFWPEESEIPGLVAENLYSNIYLTLVAGSYVRLAGAAVTGGDGNGRLDPGETANLLVTLENVGILQEATGTEAILRSDDPYVRITDASSSFGTIPTGGTADNASDPFTVTVDAAVPDGHSVVLRVEMAWSGGARNEETLAFPIGEPITADDFESGNQGWSQDPTHTASTGAWVLIDPNPTSYQPGDDTTPDPGVICWATGQNTDDGTDDVDLGISALRSPAWDLSAYENVSLNFNWFHGQRDPGDDSNDFFRIDLSNDGGATFPANLVLVGDVFHAANWRPLHADIEDHLPLTSQIVLRFQASDGSGPGDIIEAGLDDLLILVGASADEPPSAPVPLSPADGEPVLPSPVLTVANAIDPEGDPLTYGFLVFADSFFTDLARSASGIPEGNGETSWTVEPPLADGAYWWRAYAEDQEKRGLLSAASSFIVDVSTGVEEGAGALALFAPSPNPAPGGTTVRFVLPSAGRVRADVFDVNGRRVRQLVRGILPAGPQAIRWDGRDQSGNESAPGVYFIRLRTGGEEKAVKVVLVR